jgi:hypothetical protein
VCRAVCRDVSTGQDIESIAIYNMADCGGLKIILLLSYSFTDVCNRDLTLYRSAVTICNASCGHYMYRQLWSLYVPPL